jgi:hypothetical protein
MITSFFSPPYGLNGDWRSHWFPGYYGSAFGPQPQSRVDTWRVQNARQDRSLSPLKLDRSFKYKDLAVHTLGCRFFYRA